MPLGMEVGLSPGHIVLDGDTVPPSQKGGTAPPQFSAGWIKMPLGMKVGLGPGRNVTWGPSSPSQRGHSPQFSAYVICG